MYVRMVLVAVFTEEEEEEEGFQKHFDTVRLH